MADPTDTGSIRNIRIDGSDLSLRDIMRLQRAMEASATLEAEHGNDVAAVPVTIQPVQFVDPFAGMGNRHQRRAAAARARIAKRVRQDKRLWGDMAEPKD